jgi:hypothetical protein
LLSIASGNEVFDHILSSFKIINENKDCGIKIKTDIDKCGESGSNDVKNVANTDLNLICCAAWKVADCMIKKAEEKCKDTKKEFEDNLKTAISLVDSGVCNKYEKDSVKCGSMSNVKIQSYSVLMFVITSFAICHLF